MECRTKCPGPPPRRHPQSGSSLGLALTTTRRAFLTAPLAAASSAPKGLDIPVSIIQDKRSQWNPDLIAHFWNRIWPQALNDLRRCGIRLDVKWVEGEVKRLPSSRPSFAGLERGRLNIVITNRIPLEWDNGRGLNGVTTMHQGFHLCVIAVEYAHAHQAPFLSVNTCMHELLHALCLDIFENQPGGAEGAWREFCIDSFATRLWLFGDGAPIRASAEKYVQRLKEIANPLPSATQF
ncbi:MAG: hypothetical protein U0R19_37355 [Bryobacteraceae bacterium]